MPYVSDELKKAAKTYEERNEKYGDAYKKHGRIIAEIFPDGITLRSAEDFNRFGMFNSVIGKMVRYAAQFSNGGHYDSAHDASVYATMLNELDHEIREKIEKAIGNEKS